jgi:hypothetical protein
MQDLNRITANRDFDMAFLSVTGLVLFRIAQILPHRHSICLPTDKQEWLLEQE